MKKSYFIWIFAGFLLFIGSANADYTIPSRHSVDMQLNGSYIPPGFEDVDLQLNVTAEAPPGDSCTYSSGNWEVVCSDGCNISSNVDLNRNNITITGEGQVYLTANITNYEQLKIFGDSSSAKCEIKCAGGCV